MPPLELRESVGQDYPARFPAQCRGSIDGRQFGDFSPIPTVFRGGDERNPLIT
jgi:hypothetical protein